MPKHTMDRETTSDASRCGRSIHCDRERERNRARRENRRTQSRLLQERVAIVGMSFKEIAERPNILDESRAVPSRLPLGCWKVGTRDREDQRGSDQCALRAGLFVRLESALSIVRIGRVRSRAPREHSRGLSLSLSLEKRETRVRFRIGFWGSVESLSDPRPPTPPLPQVDPVASPRDLRTLSASLEADGERHPRIERETGCLETAERDPDLAEASSRVSTRTLAGTDSSTASTVQTNQRRVSVARDRGSHARARESERVSSW